MPPPPAAPSSWTTPASATTDFDLTQAQRNELFLNGVTAATDFVIEMGARGHVPRTEAEARQLVLERAGQAPAEHRGRTPVSATPVGPHHHQVPLATTPGRVEPGVGQPAQLVGQRRGPVVAVGDGRDRVGGVERARPRRPARSARRAAATRGDAGEQVRLVRAVQVVDGQGRDDEVERARRQRVGQVGHAQLDRDGRPGGARAASSMRLVLVDADGRRRPGAARARRPASPRCPVPRSSTDATSSPPRPARRPPPAGGGRRAPRPA